ncbi:hypothetical protein J437_LFUL004878 [Ladona fulva]|uniref:Uncharacterized protein n=1 Tax=Ladona fulva TaxID=123851 RepID=A0A8K0JUD4_LADFU|nr:hypothetical protein J437_LFUL004878 [Ladona fulva]
MKKGVSEEADGRSLDLEAIEEQAQRVFAEHSSLLGMGFALSNPPTIVQALDGTLPFR